MVGICNENESSHLDIESLLSLSKTIKQSKIDNDLIDQTKIPGDVNDDLVNIDAEDEMLA